MQTGSQLSKLKILVETPDLDVFSANTSALLAMNIDSLATMTDPLTAADPWSDPGPSTINPQGVR